MERQSMIKGTLILGIAGIAARFLGLFFRWPLILLIGDEGIGYYQMSYPLYMFFLATASGIPIAISKMVSERNALGDKEGTIQILRKALLLMIIMGGGFSLFMLTCSNSLIKIFKWDNKSYYAMMGVAFAPLFISVMSVFRGFFQGFQNMTPTAVSEILEQVARVVIGVGLAYILYPKGIEYSAGGAAFGAAAGGLVAGIYLVHKYFKIKRRFKIKKVSNNIKVMGRLLNIAIPISLGATVSTIMSLIDSMLVPQKLLEAGFTSTEAAILYGQLSGKASVLVNVPLTLSAALCSSIVPIIAESYALNQNKEILNKVELSIKISAVIALPSLCGLYFMASPVLNMLFPGQAKGYLILKYLSISIPFIILTQTSTAILQGIGKYIRPVLNLGIGCIAKVITTYMLVPIPKMNIYGAVIGTIIGYIIACILNVCVLKKALKIRINYYNSVIKPAFASIIMINCVVIIYKYVYNITMRNGISCLVSILAGVVVYFFFIILFGVFKYSNIKKKFFSR